MDDFQFQKVLINFFKKKGFNKLTLNDDVFLKRKNALSAIEELLDEAVKKGDINGTMINFKNLERFGKASRLAYTLFDNVKEVEIECNQNKSFAMVLMLCDHLSFDIDNPQGSTKEQFQQFVDYVDAFQVSTSTKTNRITVQFTINDVWVE